MEQPMVTAVTHAYEARVTLTGLRDEPGVAGRVFGALADANVNVDMIIQNEPVSDGLEGRPLVHRRPRGPRRRRARRSPSVDVGEGLEHRRRDRQGLDRRRRDAQPSGRRRDGVPRPRRGRDQHRDDLHLADQDLMRDRRRPRCRRGHRPARGVRARRRRGPRGGPVRRSPPAVTSLASPLPYSRDERLQGRRRRRHRRGRLDPARGPRRARLPGLRAGPVRLGALGRQAGRSSRAARSSAGRSPTRRSRASTSCSPRPAAR